MEFYKTRQFPITFLSVIMTVALLNACSSTPEKPTDENLLFYVKTERGQTLWSGWSFYIKQPQGWYHDGEYTALILTNTVVVQGEWYDPAKAIRREHLEVAASTGILFPPNFLFMAGLWPDRRCKAVFEFPFEAKSKYAIYKQVDTNDGAVVIKLYSPVDGRELSQATCS